MHVKSEIESSKNFRCCICFHVRTGTVILGVWNLVLNILDFVVLFSILIHPESQNQFTLWATSGTASPHVVNSILTQEFYNSQFQDIRTGTSETFDLDHEKRQIKDDVALAVTICTGVLTSVTVCTGALTIFLIYGTIKGKPNFLMPFFSLQVFDFIISALTAVGDFSSVADVRQMIEEASDLPLRKELLRLPPEWFCAILMIAIFVSLLLKVYFMKVVWSCYKYLKFLHVAEIVGSYIETDNEALLPPDYETATKSPPYTGMYGPPPYGADLLGV